MSSFPVLKTLLLEDYIVPAIVQTIALCYYADGETAGECCFNKFTLNAPPRDKTAYQTTRCNGECGREMCLCVVLPPEEILPRPPYTLMNFEEVSQIRAGVTKQRRAGLKKPAAKKK
jgi:hypothetical protein